MTVLPKESMRKCLHKPEHIDAIKDLIQNDDQITAGALAKALCEEHGFIAENGQLQVSGCNVVLKDMHRSGKIELPKVVRNFKSTFRSMVVLETPIELPSDLPSSVDKINTEDDLEIILLGGNGEDRDLKLIWNTLIAKEHPQGDSRLVGYMVKYLITYKGYYIGAASFSSASMNLEARDKWIGWSPEQKSTLLSQVVNMSRFLIRNDMHCKNLSSYLLSRLVKLIADDFEERYKIRPWLIESFVDTEKYAGTSYKAANWRLIGKTKGRGRNDKQNKKEKTLKDIYIYTLNKSFRKGIELPDEIEKYSKIGIGDHAELDKWVENELGGIDFGDKRIGKRLKKIASHKAQSPSASYPCACDGNPNDIQGYYDFLSSDRAEITEEAILSKHRHSTICRMKSYDRVLSLHDTSSLNYSTLIKTTGLGLIAKNKNSKGTRGLSLHSTLVTTTDGAPLGITKSPCSAPKIYSKAQKEKRKSYPIEKKSSYRWLVGYRDDVEIAKELGSTQVVSVMDREADIYELFAIADKNRKMSPLIVRAQHNRGTEDESGEKEKSLFNVMKDFKNTFEVEVKIPAQRNIAKTTKDKEKRPYKPARKAILTISYGEVILTPSNAAKERDLKPIKMYCVYAIEKNPPKGSAKISWKLLTTLEIKNNDQAIACLRYYKSRWRIEEFFRILKSCCKVEDHKQDQASKLKRVIAIDLVIAWRVMLLSFLNRTQPDIPAEAFFSTDEICVIRAIAKKKTPDVNIDTISDCMKIIASLGGYLNRKNDPPPGAQIIWKGLLKLNERVKGYRLAKLETPQSEHT
ncbi:IS4 family transposase [Sulfurimonas sp. MAG313]|nr:IS4 family transposase [Sulfurimonas sp. MAG313]MDF1880751.1 IS4 family transposase [Sulfurimonas sp. MAG313]